MRKKGGVFMRVHLPGTGGMTMIENTFIDQFMPAASGDFVKIYLYLLRCVQEGKTDVTVSQVADALHYTESDVKRAMGYWKKLHMLDYDSEETPDGVSSVQGASGQSTGSEKPLGALSEQAGGKITEFRPAQSQKTPSEEDVASLFFVAENYLGRLLNPSEQHTLLYFITDLGMDIDLIDYLLEYCISRNHTSFYYIQKVAQNWTQKGIRTVEQAKREGDLYRSEYYEIFRSLGITGRAPTAPETEYMERWLNEFGFGTDLICEACRRTILQTGRAQFSYADSILRSWHENGVRTSVDIQNLDQIHARTSQSDPSRSSQDASRRQNAGRFVNFASSGSNWDDLAMQVMQNQNTDSLPKSQES